MYYINFFSWFTIHIIDHYCWWWLDLILVYLFVSPHRLLDVKRLSLEPHQVKMAYWHGSICKVSSQTYWTILWILFAECSSMFHYSKYCIAPRRPVSLMSQGWRSSGMNAVNNSYYVFMHLGMWFSPSYLFFFLDCIMHKVRQFFVWQAISAILFNILFMLLICFFILVLQSHKMMQACANNHAVEKEMLRCKLFNK